MTCGYVSRAAARPFAIALMAALLLSTLVNTALAGPPWYVATGGDDLNPGTESSPFATIQRAIEAALPGDEVLVADGVYAGAGNRQIDFLGKAVTVRSQGGVRGNCTIRAEGYDGFLFRAGETSASLLRDLSIVGAATGIGVTQAFPSIVNCAMDSCSTGVDVAGIGAGVLMTDCRVEGGGTGVVFRADAEAGAIETTSIIDNTGHGVLTEGSWTIDAFDALVLTGCVIQGNDGAGVQHLAAAGGITLVDCDVSGNGAWGLYSAATFDRGLHIHGGSVHDNIMGGINTLGSAWDQITGCEVYVNSGPGLLTSIDAIYRVTDCLIRDNTGHGIAFGTGLANKKTARWQTSTVSGCTVTGNGGCGIDYAFGVHNDNTVTGCVVAGNAEAGIRVTAPLEVNSQARIFVLDSTLVGNADGLRIDSEVPVVLERTLIAFNSGAAVHCVTPPNLTLTCSNLFGNAGGDWVGDIAGQTGLSGNLNLEPLLCDRSGGDYHLLDISPCAAEQSACGTIGALDAGCFAKPRFLALADVPQDQGGHLRLSWQASHFDSPDAAQPVTGYGVYRRQELSASKHDGDRVHVAVHMAVHMASATAADKLLGWDYITTVPSRGDGGYQFVAPTLCDTPAAGSDSTGAWSVFMISAMTGNPFVFYDSAPDSGVSSDNLAPAAPAGLRMEADRVLAWQGSLEGDLAHYSVYGSTVDHLDGSSTLLGATNVTTMPVAGHSFPHFLVTATDIHANEGVAAALDGTSGADATVMAPLRLHPCQPNPFNPSTTIRYDLPAAGPVRIAIFDVAGRLLRTLLDGQVRPAGSHAAFWDGRDAAGRVASAGSYVARLDFGSEVRTTRLALVK
jgi:hypothetical protein